MKDTTARLQKVQLKIFIELLRIIDKHGLTYFFVCGSMLGAKRHNGFIPWDDDLDIGMPREDYEKLISVLPTELPSEIKLQTPYNDKYSPVLFAKLRLQGTKFVELSNRKSRSQHNEIFIDIFPYDGCGVVEKKARKHARILIMYRKLINNSIYRSRFLTSGFSNRVLQIIVRFVTIFIHPKYLINRYNKLTRKYSFQESEYAINSHTNMKEFLRKEILVANGVDGNMSFEGITIKGVANPDAYLTSFYGDWQKLPEESQRGNYHNIIELDFGNHEAKENKI